MGSVGGDGEDTSQKPITVLVTGFAPFKKDYPVNPSWEIVRSLPDWLPPVRAKTTGTSGAGAEPNPLRPTIPPVRILVHPSAIHVSYTVVRNLVPKLWAGLSQHDDAPASNTAAGENGGEARDGTAGRAEENGTPATASSPPLPPPPPPATSLAEAAAAATPPAIDMAIHVGMAGPRRFYSIERRGHRDGYVMRDVDGRFLHDDDDGDDDDDDGGRDDDKNDDNGGDDGACQRRRRRRWVWEGVPEELLSAFDVEDVLRRWREYSPKDMDLRISEDAGHYLCDFIYFSSLAHLYRAGRERRVLFLHVPSDASEHAIALGRELLLQLIRSVVESEVARHQRKD